MVKDPAQLLVDLNSIISSFDLDHTADAEFTSACENCKQLRAFLYCAATNKIADRVCCADPGNAKLQRYKSKQQGECILPVTTISEGKTRIIGNSDAFQKLANSLQNQTDLIEELKIGCGEARTEKKAKCYDLHGSSRRLIQCISKKWGSHSR